jgi:hypothetical protein
VGKYGSCLVEAEGWSAFVRVEGLLYERIPA